MLPALTGLAARMTDDTLAWLTLIAAHGVGPVAANRLLQQFAAPDAALSASDSQLRHAGLSAQQIHSLQQPDTARIDAAQQWLEHPGHHLVCRGSHAYPNAFNDLPDAPVAFFAHGDTDLLQIPALAMVGSRNPTQGGVANAQRFAAHIAQSGLAIVSGLAAGIDAAAHSAALDANGATVAVLGNGIDVQYPRSNADLQTRIAEHGVIISEYFPGQAPATGQFPARNRLISGLSLGVLVVEAAKRSGSLITARLAGEQGRSVFAIPGSIHNALARGCHQLIRQGALLVESGEDLFLELGPKLTQRLAAAPDTTQQPDSVTDTPSRSAQGEDYDRLLDALGWDPVSVDELVARTSLTAGELSSMLLIMELEGTVEAVPGGSYMRRR